MTIEYLINKESNELFTLKLLNDKDCEVILEYVRMLASAESETWINKYRKYFEFYYRPTFPFHEGYEYEGIFRASDEMIDFYMYLIQKRIDNINKLEGCLQLEYTTEGAN